MNSLFGFVVLCFYFLVVGGESNADRIVQFINSIPPAAKEEMETILHNQALTKGQMEQQLDSWAARQSGDFPVSYARLTHNSPMFQNQYKEVKALIHSAPQPINKSLSGADQQAIAELRQNKSITRQQERAAILEILSKEPNQAAPPSQADVPNWTF